MTIQIGDKFFRIVRRNRHVVTVTAIKKRYIETDDGRKWNKETLNEWGNADSFYRAYLQPWGDAEAEALEAEQKRLAYLHATRRDIATLEQHAHRLNADTLDKARAAHIAIGEALQKLRDAGILQDM